MSPRCPANVTVDRFREIMWYSVLEGAEDFREIRWCQGLEEDFREIRWCQGLEGAEDFREIRWCQGLEGAEDFREIR